MQFLPVIRYFYLLIILLIIPKSYGLEVPVLTSGVIDKAGILTKQEAIALDNLIRKIKNNGPQFQILIINDLEDETIETYSIKVVDKWKLGDQKKDDGLLILLALKQRKLRVEVGQGLEGYITDIDASRTIKLMTPYFKKSRFYNGFLEGLLFLASKAEIQIEEYKTYQNKAKRVSSEYSIAEIIFFIIIILIILLGRGRSFGGGHYYYGSGRSRGGFSSGGFGSSWSGGGGGFSGGGASGDF